MHIWQGYQPVPLLLHGFGDASAPHQLWGKKAVRVSPSALDLALQDQ